MGKVPDTPNQIATMCREFVPIMRRAVAERAEPDWTNARVVTPIYSAGGQCVCDWGVAAHAKSKHCIGVAYIPWGDISENPTDVARLALARAACAAAATGLQEHEEEFF